MVAIREKPHNHGTEDPGQIDQSDSEGRYDLACTYAAGVCGEIYGRQEETQCFDGISKLVYVVDSAE